MTMNKNRGTISSRTAARRLVGFWICLLSPRKTIIISIEAFLIASLSFPGMRASTADLSQCSESGGNHSPDFQKWVSSEREFEGLDAWASQNGILMEHGFQLTKSTVHLDNMDYDDWNVNLRESASESDRVLHIPSHWIFSGTRMEEELRSVDGFQDAINYVSKRNCEDQLPQFFLWIKVLQEFEKGQDSLWYPWIQSLPRKFGNALYLDPVEMECLPPYAWSLAKLELLHLEVFQRALRDFIPSVVSEESTRTDTELARWALSVVFTRCWGKADDEDDEETKAKKQTHIAPIGDMLNHGDPANTFISYDSDGNCDIFLKTNMTTAGGGSALSLSYGRTTNPSRFLVLYGFVDLRQSRIFSQVLVTHPSQQHKDIGYDVSKMVFSTDNGEIAEEVFDVTLYSILEQVPDLQKLFYESHIRGDRAMTQSLKQQYHLEICIVLKKHVDGKLLEMRNLLQKIDTLYYYENKNEIVQQHPRLLTIFEHNKFLYFTFSKVKARLDQMIQDEMKQRQQQQ